MTELDQLKADYAQLGKRIEKLETKDWPQKGNEYWFVESDSLLDAILSAIKNRLPKEKPKIIDVQDTLHRNVGYNTCLQDVKQALDIESEGASNG